MNKAQPDGCVRLCVVSSAEWAAAVKENKGAPIERRRHFILDYIADGDSLDCMVMEVPYADHLQWNKERLAARRNRKAGSEFRHISLDAPPTGSDDTTDILELLPSEDRVEAAACDTVLLDELRQALSAWKPWACDLLELYLQGEKRRCTAVLAKRYSVSPQVIRKYKRQFEEFAKKFLKGVSF